MLWEFQQSPPLCFVPSLLLLTWLYDLLQPRVTSVRCGLKWFDTSRCRWVLYSITLWLRDCLFVQLFPNIEANTKEGKVLEGASLCEFFVQKTIKKERKHIVALNCRSFSGLFSNVSAPAALCQGFLFYCRSTVEQTYKLAARGPNAALEQPQSSPLSFYYWGN